MLQIQPAQPQPHQPHSGPTTDGALHDVREPLPGYPSSSSVSQYSSDDATEAAESAATSVVTVTPEHLPNSPPPPYRISDEQRPHVRVSDEQSPDVDSTDRRTVEDGNSTNIGEGATIARGDDFVDKQLPHAVSYEDDINGSIGGIVGEFSTGTPLSSSPSHHLDSSVGGETDVSKLEESNREQNVDSDSRTIAAASSPQTFQAKNMPSINDAVNAIKGTHSGNVAANKEPATVVSRTDNLPEQRPLEGSSESTNDHHHRQQSEGSGESTNDHHHHRQQFDDPLKEGSSLNENHHNHNSYMEQSLTASPPKDVMIAPSLLVSNGSTGDTDTSSNENHKLCQRDSDYNTPTTQEDPLEVQRMMEELGTVDRMFQFEELGSRTDALEDASFSSFRKQSTSEGS